MIRKSLYHFLGATVLLCLGTPPMVSALDVYVTPQGRAENPGTRRKPVATLEQARELMRQSGHIHKQQKPKAIHITQH